MSRTVVVTGGANGIGRALAVEAAHRGASVVVIDREPAGALVAEIAAAGGRAWSFVADVTDPEGFAAVADKIRSTAPAITGVVANIGFGVPGALMDTSDEQVSEVLDVNVLGTLRTVRTFLPDLLEFARSGPANVVITGSEHSLGVPRDQVPGAYTVAKHALVGVADVLRCQLEDTAISVSLLTPGWTTTSAIQRYMADDPELAATVAPVAQSPQEVAAIAWDGVEAGLFIVPTNAHSKMIAALRIDQVEQGFSALSSSR